MNLLPTPQRRLALVVAAAAAVAVATSLVVASQVGSRENEPAVRAAPERSLFAGIEQHGAALGSPAAPVTLVEYADLQCPYCAQWARDALPTLVDEYVRPGKLRIVFRGLAFIGPESDTALRTAIAASGVNRMWDVVHGLYAAQGAENAGWVTDDLVLDIASGVPGLNGAKLLDDRWQDSIGAEMKRAAAAAEVAGVTGTPAFEIGRTGGRLQLVQLGSLGPEGIVPAIEAVLAA